MAKSKKKGLPQQKAGLSETEYMRKVMRKLPIEQCYVNADWREQGMAHVVVVRRRPDDKFAMVNYLVDTYCLGVKDVMWITRMEQYELDKFIERLTDKIDLAMCDYATAHNLVLGAIDFAEEAGIEPCKEWAIGQYGLDEDTDDIELIEFDYGINGKHFLNTYTKAEGMKYLPILQAHLGSNFGYRFEDEPDFGLKYNDMPTEEYVAPQGVVYPDKLELKNPIVGEILLNEDYYNSVPVEEMAKIAALDRDELVEDLTNLGMYLIGQDDGESEVKHGAMLHIVTILNTLADPRGLDVLLAMLRMDQDFLDTYFGDAAPNLFTTALARCGVDRIDALEAYLNEEGRTWYNRSIFTSALELIYQTHPDEVVAVLRRQLGSMPERVPELKSADYDYAGFLVSSCMSIGDRSLLPIIKDLFDQGLVNDDICGNYDIVLKDYGDLSLEKFMTMDEMYHWIENFNGGAKDKPGDKYEKLFR